MKDRQEDLAGKGSANKSDNWSLNHRAPIMEAENRLPSLTSTYVPWNRRQRDVSEFICQEVGAILESPVCAHQPKSPNTFCKADHILHMKKLKLRVT